MTEELKNQTVTLHNKISSHYRAYHIDGAYGGFTPKGLISISFFSERFPIPKSSDFTVVDNKLGEKISDSSDSKVGIIREYEIGVYLDINTAKDIINLLSTKISELEAITKPKA